MMMSPCDLLGSVEVLLAAAVVVTRTVRDLASGSDLAFAPLGTVGLRGIPGEWELFEATEH